MRTTLNKLVPLAALTAVLGGARPTIADGAETKARLESLTKSVNDQLATINGKSIYLMTDKPLYHPGEAIWFRAWEVSVKTLAGVAGEDGITFQLLDARGSKGMRHSFEKFFAILCGAQGNSFFCFYDEMKFHIKTGGAVMRLGQLVLGSFFLGAVSVGAEEVNHLESLHRRTKGRDPTVPF